MKWQVLQDLLERSFNVAKSMNLVNGEVYTAWMELLIQLKRQYEQEV